MRGYPKEESDDWGLCTALEEIGEELGHGIERSSMSRRAMFPSTVVKFNSVSVMVT